MVPPVLRGEAVWSELRKYGIGWWVRSNDTLRRLIEKVTPENLYLQKDMREIENPVFIPKSCERKVLKILTTHFV